MTITDLRGDKPLASAIIDFRGVVQEDIEKNLSKSMNFFYLTNYFSNPQMKTPNLPAFSDFRHYFLIQDPESENISVWDSYFLQIRKRLGFRKEKKKSCSCYDRDRFV